MKLRDLAARLKPPPTLPRDLAGLAGVGSIAYGCWAIYHPAGFIVGGAFLLAGCWLAVRAGL